MGCFADATAAKYGFTRADQDAFAAESVRRAQRAVARATSSRDRARHGQDAQGRTGRRAGRDPVPARHRQDPDAEARLRQGRHGDGRLFLVDFRRRRRARGASESAAQAGGPQAAGAARLLCQPRAGAGVVHDRARPRDPEGPRSRRLESADVDLFEINEAFACVTMAAMQDLGLTTTRSTSTAAPARWATLSAPPARDHHHARARAAQARPARGIASQCIGGGEACAVAIAIELV
jgi:acetyl-CoA C-acetyltransferase